MIEFWERKSEDLMNFAKSWLACVFFNTLEFTAIAFVQCVKSHKKQDERVKTLEKQIKTLENQLFAKEIEAAGFADRLKSAEQLMLNVSNQMTSSIQVGSN